MTPEQAVITQQQCRAIDRLLDTLPLRQCLAIRWRFGLRCDAMKYTEMAERFGITPARVRQITLEGLLKFRRRFLLAEFPEIYRAEKNAERKRIKEEEAQFAARRERAQREFAEKHSEAARAFAEKVARRPPPSHAGNYGFFMFTATREWYEKEYLRR